MMPKITSGSRLWIRSQVFKFLPFLYGTNYISRCGKDLWTDWQLLAWPLEANLNWFLALERLELKIFSIHGMPQSIACCATIQNTRFRDDGFASCRHVKQYWSTDIFQSFFGSLTRDIPIIACQWEIPNFPWDQITIPHIGFWNNT